MRCLEKHSMQFISRWIVDSVLRSFGLPSSPISLTHPSTRCYNPETSDLLTFISTDSESFSRFTILMATFCPVMQCTPSFTRPMERRKALEFYRNAMYQTFVKSIHCILRNSRFLQMCLFSSKCLVGFRDEELQAGKRCTGKRKDGAEEGCG